MAKGRRTKMPKRPMPLPMLILLELLAIGVALVVFALFHHVLPRQEQAVGISSGRVSTQMQESAASELTAAPEETAAPATSAPEATAAPATSAPEATAASATAAPEATVVPATAAPETTAAPEATAAPATAVPEATAVPATAAPEATAAPATAAPEATAVPEITAAPEATAAPATAVPEATAVSVMAAPEVMSAAADATLAPTPVPDPTAVPEPVGYFGTKFADKFTDGEVIQTENSYQSANLNVTWTNVRDLGTEIYIADIYIKDITCLRTGFGDDTFGRGYYEWLESMAERFGSVVAVNGDFCGGRNNGVVIRNGVLYREDENLKRDVCVLYWDGTMQTFAPDEFDTREEMARGAYQAWNFGPYLLGENGEALEEFNSSVKPQNPRTAIGYFEPGHYCLVVVDGRSYQSIGMSMKNLSLFMEGLGCSVAYNLDGGESSEMVWGSERISVPYDNGRQNSDGIFIIDQILEE